MSDPKSTLQSHYYLFKEFGSSFKTLDLADDLSLAENFTFMLKFENQKIIKENQRPNFSVDIRRLQNVSCFNKYIIFVLVAGMLLGTLFTLLILPSMYLALASKHDVEAPELAAQTG